MPTRIVPVTVVTLDTKGTARVDDDVIVRRQSFRVEIYEDGVDPAREPTAQPIAVYASENDVAGDADDVAIDLQLRARLVEGAEVLDPANRAVLINLISRQLASAYPGGAGLDPDLVRAMPAQVARGLVDALLRGDTTIDLVLPLIETAAGTDQNERARAAAALFGIAFKHLDADPKRWIEITGFDFTEKSGGNCATFIGVGFLYAGFTQFGEFTVEPRNVGLPLLENYARGAIGLGKLFAGHGGYVLDRMLLRTGDLVVSDGDDHISMVVGFGPARPGEDPPRVFPTLEAARAYYGEDVRLEPYVVDHDPSNSSSSPRPMERVFSGGKWFYASVGDPRGPHAS